MELSREEQRSSGQRSKKIQKKESVARCGECTRHWTVYVPSALSVT